MFAEEQEIPLIGRLESTTTLLKARPQTSSRDRRLEDWIASNLDQENDPARENHWNRLIQNLPTFRPRSRKNGQPGADAGPAVASQGGWARFQVAYRRGYTMVRLLDQALVQRSHLRELESDLMDLIEVGNQRIVLNFSGVTRLGSWIIGVVGNAHRRCAEVDGGRLKICGLDPQLAEIFQIVGMARDLEMHPDEAAAIASPWPTCSMSRQLPVDLLGAIRSVVPVPPICGGAPSETEARSQASRPATGARPVAPGRSEPSKAFTVRLQIEGNSGDGRSVILSKSRLVIGREQPCKLRLKSAQVSKQHASIEIRDGRVFVRDLDSTNGTMVRGKLLRDAEAEVHDHDEIRIGPASLTVLIDRSAPVAIPSDEPESILLSHPPGSASALSRGPAVASESDPMPTEEMAVAEAEDDAEGTLRVRVENMEGALVVTPQFADLDHEEAIDAVRSKLESLREAGRSNHVVINLEFVNHLSRKAIAFLLAHHVRLEWEGGGLRICQAHARIIALLDQVRLTMLVDCFPTLDEAVLCTWPTAEERLSARS